MVRTLFGQRQYQTQSRFIGEIDKSFLNIQGESTPRIQKHTTYKPKVEKRESLVGKMVSHSELGTGVVIAENGDILTVAFKTKGIKNVAKNFIKLI